MWEEDRFGSIRYEDHGEKVDWDIRELPSREDGSPCLTEWDLAEVKGRAGWRFVIEGMVAQL